MQMISSSKILKSSENPIVQVAWRLPQAILYLRKLSYVFAMQKAVVVVSSFPGFYYNIKIPWKQK